MRKIVIFILLLSSLFILFGCSVNKTIQDDDAIVKLIDANAEIQSLYSSRCLNCHAIDLSGVMGEKTNLQRVHERLTYDQIVQVISEGRELMPSFKERLSEDDITGLASWLSKQ